MEHESDGNSNCNWRAHQALVQGLEDLEIIGLVETIKTTVLLRSARMYKRELETFGDQSL